MMMKCCGKSLSEVLVASPIGNIKIVGCQQGLHLVKQADADDTSFYPDTRKEVTLIQSGPPSLHCDAVSESVKWLENYFHHKNASTTIPPLCPSVVRKGSFCEKALSLLPKAVPIGSTISYKHLAELCGNEKACRAAGHAMATNPVSFLIPCHRVVTSHGMPGNYSRGKKNSIKVWLLDYEKDTF